MPGLITHIRANFNKLPVDVLVAEYLHYRQDLVPFEYTPNLAQHMGLRSTFQVTRMPFCSEGARVTVRSENA